MTQVGPSSELIRRDWSGEQDVERAEEHRRDCLKRPRDFSGLQYGHSPMRLITTAEWSAKYFSEVSRPAEVTIRRWCRNWKESGLARKVGGAWFIDEHRWLAQGDELVEAVLSA